MLKDSAKSLFPPTIHSWVYFVALCILAASLPTSRFMLSLIQILMGANWLLEGHYREKLNRFAKSRAAWFLAAIYLVHVIGLLWTQDLQYGIGTDLKNKLPMLTLTFMVFSSRPLSRIQIHLLLYVFFASLLVTTFIGLWVYLSGSYVNFRHISPYVSHVYLGMMLAFSAFALPWKTYRLTTNIKWRITAWLIAAWFVLFLLILRSLTGLLCFAGGMGFLILWYLFTDARWGKKMAAVAVLIIIPVLLSIPVYLIYRNLQLKIIPEASALEARTAEGNSYTHSPESFVRENGHPVYLFIAEEEARKAWNERSALDFDGPDRAGNELRLTLYRYLSSRGLRKDTRGVMNLEEDDIDAIERGIPNYHYTLWPGIMVRLHQSFWEVYWYRQTGNPTGHTFTQRVELWKASAIAFREKPLSGWGTGDIFIAMEYGLQTMDSQLGNYRMKPHNQYLLFLLILGVAGSLLIYLSYALFVKYSGAFRFMPFNIFLVIMLISMLGNNPLDAQVGHTFWVFFSLYFGCFMPLIEKTGITESGA